MANRITKLYKELAEFPVYTSAFFLKSDSSSCNVRVSASVRDFLRKLKRTISKTVITTSPDKVIASPVYDSGDALASVPSPSGKRLGVLRETFDGTAKKRYVEVWRGNKLEAIKDVTKTHDDFHVHPLLFSLSFSRSESSFIYTAEAKAPEVDEDSNDKNLKYRYLPDFGEKLDGKKRPAIYLFRWTTCQYDDDDETNLSRERTENDTDCEPTVVALKPSLPEGSTFAFGQGVFAPDQNHIFATGYEQTLDGRRLGVQGCWTHPSAIFRLDLPQDIPKDVDEVSVSATRLTPPTMAARSVRVNPSDSEGSYPVVWLSNPVGGAHASSVSLWILRPTDNEPKLLVDSVYEPKDSETFPGLYVDELPRIPFISLDASGTSTHIVTHSVWGSRLKVLQISLGSGKIETLAADPHYSWIILNTDGRESVLAKRSSMTSPEELMLGQLPKLAWRVLDKPLVSRSTREQLDTLQSEIIAIPDRYPTEVITLRCAGKHKLPMISIPHGGPHATFTLEFDSTAICFALEGYHVNSINFTGSLGYGQKFVDGLLGRIGELDVQDSYRAIQHLVRLGYGEVGQGKQFIQGGSHGGFLAAHLVSQYPTFFSAAVMRNPVISAGEMFSVSDIPDWALWESGQSFGPTTTLAPEIFKALQQASPISYVDAIQTPVLLHVGENDRRVPPSQGRNYYYSLKGRGKEVEMLVFPGNGHGLDTVEAELAGFETMREWFARYLK